MVWGGIAALDTLLLNLLYQIWGLYDFEFQLQNLFFGTRKPFDFVCACSEFKLVIL